MTTHLNLSPLDGRYATATRPLSKMASEYGLMYYRLKVEIEWVKALADLNLKEIGSLSASAKKYLDEILTSFDEKQAQLIKDIESKTNHDVKALEYYLKDKFKLNDELKTISEFIHFACTSEDINNLAYALMLTDIKEKLLLPQLKQISDTLGRMAKQHAHLAMLSRTHGQPASPTTLGKEIANVVYRLQRQIQQLKAHRLLGKINGAVGNFNAHAIAYPDVSWLDVSENFIKKLDLEYNPFTTQIEPHDTLAEYFHILSRANIILIDFCRDVWGYISLGYFKQKLKEGEVGSSTMPHKVNPIDFENAEGNLGLANAILNFFCEKLPISRWQRDLSDSTVQRNVGVGMGYIVVALNALEKGIGKLEVDEQRIIADLDQHWEVLGEAIQTVMRRYNVPNPYEALKEFTRGKSITVEALAQFIESLNLPTDVKARLKALKPQSYTGLAAELTIRL